MSGLGGFFSSGAADADIEAGAGTSLLADWKNYATTTASKLNDIGERIQTNTSSAFNSAANPSGLTSSLSGLTSLGSSGFSNFSASGLTETLKGANTSLTGALNNVTTGVEGLSNQMASGVMSGATRLTSEMQNAATLATGEVQRGINATSTGLQMAGSATISGVKGVGTAVTTGVKDGVQTMQSFSHQRLMYFGALLFTGSFLMGLAFIIGLPTIVLAPAKFAFCFTAGSLCNMAAVAALRGPQAQVQQMMARDRLPFSASYICSMLGTLWAAMIYHSYILTVVFSIWQVTALVYYIATHFPMGVTGMKMIATIVWTAAKPFVMAFNKFCGLAMRTLVK
uniref:Vesicle transport protein n=1 Tax=Pyramimonas obovata TaxID=1411642 RepID=A0A7S0RSQ2_9CHLO|mmetsp:Transcript_4671/g.9501  ORF Transcript_4671/g.9501 Transcript_4671/m.9501 type:complete len:340 (+) Transcript_4671:394-1413(+)|eukprot:CAMPEP_0118935036 /NCGR_PEP_ID=MMETSP1169-20130426/14771_1 /TAXON_ID=36882 /ORGANISM="Pyramimonas obovata, Strain CCMP722" /LENGTH=339 /DNA_ID=CAMNT_0006878019 /DNA_START=391 /DNA_END=1410 /DNA_ORIENTATION=+